MLWPYSKQISILTKQKIVECYPQNIAFPVFTDFTRWKLKDPWVLYCCVFNCSYQDFTVVQEKLYSIKVVSVINVVHEKQKVNTVDSTILPFSSIGSHQRFGGQYSTVMDWRLAICFLFDYPLCILSGCVLLRYCCFCLLEWLLLEFPSKSNSCFQTSCNHIFRNPRGTVLLLFSRDWVQRA